MGGGSETPRQRSEVRGEYALEDEEGEIVLGDVQEGEDGEKSEESLIWLIVDYCKDQSSF